MVDRASPAQLRKALEIAHTFAKAGLRFVPMPVVDDAEFDQRMQEVFDKLAQLEQAAARSEAEKGGA